jgi:hypothetical protein
MKIYKTNEILGKLDNCIKYKIPFSHIRFGDGGIKFLHSILFNDSDQLDIIVKKEGLPKSKMVEIFELWGYYARRADFIDTPEVYFSDEFWNRMRTSKKSITHKTKEKLEMWRTLYSNAEFDNENYCNPESNYLMVIKNGVTKNLLDIMNKRKIAIITAKPEVKSKLHNYDVDIIKIVGHFEDQYKNSFKKVAKFIGATASKYDLWLVAAGELGRLYSGMIKENGGRCVDVGFVIEYWVGERLHPRLQVFMDRSINNPLEIKLTDVGKKYRSGI